MSERKILLLFVGISAIALISAADDPQITYLGSGCSETLNRTYRNFAAFNNNRAAVYESLVSNLSSNGSHFATSFIDNGTTDPVYGLAQCREYLTTNECLECFNAAKAKVKEVCPRSNGAKLHLDGCFLRFENNSLLYNEGNDNGDTENCSFVSESLDFSNTAHKLLSQLIEKASTNNGYDIGSLNSIYGLVQCVKSINDNTCQGCLNTALDRLVKKCPLSQEGRALMAGCFMRYANYSFFPASPDDESRSESKRVPILLGSMGGTGLFAALCVAVLCRYSKCRHRFKSFIPAFPKAEEDRHARDAIKQVTIFNYETLRDATANFDPSNLLGKGGFGEVYKGKLLDGKVIAVKKLSERQITQVMNEFLTEVKLISSVRHRNLVRLLGCCSHGHQRLLVYEFMSNNSLHKHLFGDKGMFLDWETRLNIIVGTARGLAYLHEESNFRIVHRDIKPGNILLDHKLFPKIADFGLARFYPEGDSHVSTKVGGTIGYTAPEYVVRGQLTEKADVYSFGVVVLEIVSGRKCIDEKLPDPLQLLLQWIWQLYEREQILEVVDSKLKGEYPDGQMVRAITIALLCVKAIPSLRPTMTQIISMLTSDSEITDQPTKPAFVESNVNDRTPSSSSRDSTGSHGSVTVSLFAR